MSRIVLALFALVGVLSQSSFARPEPAYHIIKKVSLPGGTSWDHVFVYTEGRRIYVSHGT